MGHTKTHKKKDRLRGNFIKHLQEGENSILELFSEGDLDWLKFKTSGENILQGPFDLIRALWKHFLVNFKIKSEPYLW